MSNQIPEIKKDFFAFRNGIVADSLRKLYPASKMIYGLTVPQFLEMSKKYPKSLDLGLALWNNNSSREDRLFALYLIPPSELKEESAISMINDVESVEQAEFLAFKLLRFLPYAYELYHNLVSGEKLQQLPSYCLTMLKKNLDIQRSDLS